MVKLLFSSLMAESAAADNREVRSGDVWLTRRLINHLAKKLSGDEEEAIKDRRLRKGH